MKAQYIALGKKSINYYYRYFKCCETCLVNTRCVLYMVGPHEANPYINVVIQRPCEEWIKIRKTFINYKRHGEHVTHNILWL